MTGVQGETDLETAVRKLTVMRKHLDEFFKHAANIPEHLTAAYKAHHELKLIAGGADLNFAAYNAADAIENLRKHKQGFDVVTASAADALKAIQG